MLAFYTKGPTVGSMEAHRQAFAAPHDGAHEMLAFLAAPYAHRATLIAVIRSATTADAAHSFSRCFCAPFFGRHGRH
jgi:hypothetical protein